MTLNPSRAHEFEHMCKLIDIGEELDILEEEIDLAGRLMMTFNPISATMKTSARSAAILRPR